MSSVLRRLTPEMRKALRVALDSGRLTTPITELSLRPYVHGLASEVSRELDRLKAKGLTGELLSELLAVAEPAVPESRTQLVWSGPDVTADMRDTGVVVRDLFGGAQEHVLVAGFAVYQGQDIFAELASRMDERTELSVEMYLNIERRYGDTSAADEIVHEFARDFQKRQWPGDRLPALFYDPRALEPHDGAKRSALHAKCVVVDELRVLVTSANFTEAAQQRNVEVGVLVHDAVLARSLHLQFDRLRSAGHLKTVPGVAKS